MTNSATAPNPGTAAMLVRTVAAVAAGLVIAVVLAYGAAIVVVLATIGMPLGSQPRDLTAVENGALLLLVGVAAAIGGRIAARVARRARLVAVTLVAAVLAVTMLWGFGGRNSWPGWWGPVVAAVMAGGACAGGLLRRARRASSSPGT